MLSPDSTRPEAKAAFSATSNISSVEAGLSISIGITPQLIINPRSTFSSKVIAKISASGRYFEIKRAVAPDSVKATISLTSIDSAAFLTADATTSVTESLSKFSG